MLHAPDGTYYGLGPEYDQDVRHLLTACYQSCHDAMQGNIALSQMSWTRMTGSSHHTQGVAYATHPQACVPDAVALQHLPPSPRTGLAGTTHQGEGPMAHAMAMSDGEGSDDENMSSIADVEYDHLIDQKYVDSLTFLGKKLCKTCCHSADNR